MTKSSYVLGREGSEIQMIRVRFVRSPYEVFVQVLRGINGVFQVEVEEVEAVIAQILGYYAQYKAI